MNDKKTIYCCNCLNEAKYKYCEEEYCYECLCEVLKDEIIDIVKEKFEVYEI
ncbi:hypothetical protein [Clostridium culturomicium]|uniref:hypothetical protein n=1 Tax=Clostridium culturomicium TaxID=1499683 RepID=UPI0038575CAB